MSRVTKLVSVRAEARRQPTYPVVSHPPLCSISTPGWLRKEGEEGDQELRSLDKNIGCERKETVLTSI